MAIYGTPLTLGGGGGGKNETLPPLLYNFKANKNEKNELIPPTKNTISFKDIPDGKKIKLVKGSKISGTVTYGTTDGLNHRIVFNSKEWRSNKFELENGEMVFDISRSDISMYLNGEGKDWFQKDMENFAPPSYGSEVGFLTRLGISRQDVEKYFNLINANKYSTLWVVVPWVEDILGKPPYTYFTNIETSDFADYVIAYGDNGEYVKRYDFRTTKVPSGESIVGAFGFVNPMMEPKPETQVALDSDGSYYMFEEPKAEITLSADKMQESRATDLAGAVWVYGDHIPKNVSDGTKIALSRDEIVSTELGLSLTLKELPPSDANHKVVVNIPEIDGQLHRYIYLTDNYNSSGKCLLLRDKVDKQISCSGNKYENSTFDVTCQDFKNNLADSVKNYITSVNVFSWNSSTGGKNITREIFLLSQREAGGGSDVNIKQLPFFNVQNNRIAKDDSGAAKGWWCREFNGENPNYVNYQGVISTMKGSQYFRPAIAILPNLPLNPLPKEDGSYDFLETAKSKAKTVKETKQTVGSLPSKSKVKLGRYAGNELSWLTTKDAEGRQYLRLDAGSVAVFPFKSMIFDNKEPNNTDTNIGNNGNNMFTLSNLFQWLNSDKSANNWYTPQHTYDAPPPYVNQDGFLKGWTEQEKQLLLNKVWEVRVPSSVSSSLLKFTAKVVLPSTTEMGLENNAGGSRLDIFNNASDRIINGSPWWSRNSEKTNTHQVVHPNYNGNIVSSNCNREEIQVVPLVSIPVNTPVELGSDGSYHLLLDVMLPKIKSSIVYPNKKDFYARQFTCNPKNQYQTMIEGAIATVSDIPSEPPEPEGSEISKLPSRSKIKLGKWNNTVLKWVVCRDSVDNSVRLILDTDSISYLGRKQFDAPETSNSNGNRRSFGNNRYIWSNLHQWLNTGLPAYQWYTKQHSVDVTPSYHDQAGFLNQWSEKELSVLELATWDVLKANFDGGGVESYRGKITLPSISELTSESNRDGNKLDIFTDDESRKAPYDYWLRTPISDREEWTQIIEQSGHTSSTQCSDTAKYIRPICKPIPTTLVSLQPDSDGCYTLI